MHASSHYDSVAKRSWEVKAGDDKDLDFVLENGHEWVILDGEKLTKEDCEEISEWYNADQNTNNAATEIAILAHTSRACAKTPCIRKLMAT